MLPGRPTSMTRRLIPLLASAVVAAVVLAEPSGARTPKPTVAVMNATSDYLIGGVSNDRWVSADTLQERLPDSAPVRSLSLSGERSLGTKKLAATQPPDICRRLPALGAGDRRSRRRRQHGGHHRAHGLGGGPHRYLQSRHQRGEPLEIRRQRELWRLTDHCLAASFPFSATAVEPHVERSPRSAFADIPPAVRRSVP